MEFSLDDITQILDGKLVGDGKIKVNSLGKIEEAEAGAISFLSNPKYENFVYTTNASAVIVSETFEPKQQVNTSLIKVKDPYTSFTTLLEEYDRLNSFSKMGVEDPAFIGANCKVGENIYRGAFSYVGNNCTIGNNVKIYPHAYIGDNVTIGNNTIVFPGVKIYADTKIGSYCTFHAGAIIGSDGFGFAPQEDGTYKTIPQIGNVVIDDHVSIGSNAVIDCATMGSTTLERGVKIDNLVQIAHNVAIGSDTVVAAQSGISGSATIGKNCVLAGQVGVVGHVSIADKTIVAAQAGIGKSIKTPSVQLGSPSLEKTAFMKSYALFKNLPAILKRIEELEEKVVNSPTI